MNKVSVIVPVYNQEKYLYDCLNSIVSQSYKNIEIIVIDDCSTDDSRIIIDKWSSRDNRIKKIYLSSNSGVSNARNIGIDASSGEYLIFVDSDDHIESDMIETLVNCNLNYKYDIVFCDIKQFGGERHENIIHSALDRNDGEIEFDDYLFILSKLNIDIFIGGPYCKLFLTSSLKKWEVKFEVNQTIGEDFIFNMEFQKNKPRMYYVKKNLYNYRIGNINSLSKKKYKSEYYATRYKKIYKEYTEVLKMGNNDILIENGSTRLYIRVVRITLINAVYANKRIKEKSNELDVARNILREYDCNLDKNKLKLKESILFSLLDKRQYMMIIIAMRITEIKCLILEYLKNN